MQINIKQHEIIAALTAYIASQGINLTGKTVEVSFTAGRKETGVSADIIIEDANIKTCVVSPVGASAVDVTPEVEPVPHDYVEPPRPTELEEVQPTPTSLFG